jgi:predicted anti-sigma-YlaC factor YlaD
MPRILFILALAVAAAVILIGNHLWWHSATAGLAGLIAAVVVIVSVIRLARRREAVA